MMHKIISVEIVFYLVLFVRVKHNAFNVTNQQINPYLITNAF